MPDEYGILANEPFYEAVTGDKAYTCLSLTEAINKIASQAVD